MRLTRTLIMGALMVIPGLFLGLLLWILVGQPSDGQSPIVEALVCNAIPLASIFSGLFFATFSGLTKGIWVFFTADILKINFLTRFSFDTFDNIVSK